MPNKYPASALPKVGDIIVAPSGIELTVTHASVDERISPRQLKGPVRTFRIDVNASDAPGDDVDHHEVY